MLKYLTALACVMMLAAAVGCISGDDGDAAPISSATDAIGRSQTPPPPAPTFEPSPEDRKTASVTGSMALHEVLFEGEVLPPNAVVEVKLLDLLPNGSVVTIEKMTVEDQRQSPIRFELSYDPDRVNEDAKHAIQVAIEVDGRLEFNNDTEEDLVTLDGQSHIEIELFRLERVSP